MSKAKAFVIINGDEFKGEGDPAIVFEALGAFLQRHIPKAAAASPPRGEKKRRTPKKPKA